MGALQGVAMKVEKTDQGMDVACVPGEFRENYRFLRELIDCRAQNNTAEQCLKDLAQLRVSYACEGLNRRQTKLLKNLSVGIIADDWDCTEPPVPVELEASIRVRKKSTWLPWEAEAIRKIERWRSDVALINRHLSAGDGLSTMDPLPFADKSN
jgi:hypothetical protein